MFKLRIASAALAASLLGVAVGATAQEATPVVTGETTEETTQGGDTTQIGGAEGLVAAVVQAADTIDINDTNIEVITVTVEDSLNDVNILTDILNESPILNENNVVITDVIDVSDVDIDPVIAIGILQGGDIIIFTGGDE